MSRRLLLRFDLWREPGTRGDERACAAGYLCMHPKMVLVMVVVVVVAVAVVGRPAVS